MKTFSLKTFVLIIVSIVLLPSCTSKTYKFLQSYDTGLEPYPLRLKMGTELFNLREDIYRETTTQETTNSSGETVTKTVDKSYHPLGFHICKGVFLDLNENLTINIPEMFGNYESSNFEIEEEKNSFLSKLNYSVKKEGNKITRTSKGLIVNYVDKIQLEGDKITINESGILSINQTILFTPEKMTMNSQLLNWFPPTITKEGENSYKVKEGFNTDKIEQPENDLIIYNRNLKINRLANKIEFNYPSRYNPIYLIRLEDGLIFEKANGFLVRIKVLKNKIEVYYGDKLTTTYTLTPILN
jgi:hypothetical protein